MYGVAILIGNTVANKHRTPGRFMCALAELHRCVTRSTSKTKESSRNRQRDHTKLDAACRKQFLNSNTSNHSSRSHCCCSHTSVTRPGLPQSIAATAAQNHNEPSQLRPTSLVNFPFIDQDRHSPKTPTGLELVNSLGSDKNPLVSGHPSEQKVHSLRQLAVTSSEHTNQSFSHSNCSVSVAMTAKLQQNLDSEKIPSSPVNAFTHNRPFKTVNYAALSTRASFANQEATQSTQRTCRCCYSPPADTDDGGDIDVGDDDLTISLATFNNNNLSTTVRQHYNSPSGCCGCRHQHHVAHPHHHQLQQHPDPHQQAINSKHHQRQKEHEIRSRSACVLCMVFLVTQFVFDLFSLVLWFV